MRRMNLPHDLKNYSATNGDDPFLLLEPDHALAALCALAAWAAVFADYL